ncbi:protoporphyrinogen oxidase [Granulicella sp. WH15]|uniref:protoporphyrinogen oxidase n=1 Tax=Granulicella sp. WH15 TaxID=2602070 RepID=UPI0013669C92|nr:protoporphyrinogen oxidase [Granulicella sp. WH15]QHN02679.1 protoporphyrinogen oxidase [Granulicella sp. WH15]
MTSKPRTAIIGGGIAGVTAAWQLAQIDPTQDVTLFEASPRLGGIVETVRREGFVVECGPDGWITEKPWARELAEELGLGNELISSLDATRITYILRNGRLIPIPDGMRMMVPTDLEALTRSELFSPAAIAAYASEPGRAEELRAATPDRDESVASFVLRHFGEEVLHTVAAPLLSGVFGGDVTRLSVRAVMPAFVQMEREHGSLILALQSKPKTASPQPIFTSLASGSGSLIERMVAAIPPEWIRLNTTVSDLVTAGQAWTVELAGKPPSYQDFDRVIVATPGHISRQLLGGIVDTALLPFEATSAVIIALAFTQPFDLPPGFGFLVPDGETNNLLAGTFIDQKFPNRVPQGTHLLRAFFGGERAPAIAIMPDDEIAAQAFEELQKILGPLPEPSFTIVRRWPHSLPQYAVGHLDRLAELDRQVAQHPGLHLLGNAYRGVGLPDLIREARTLAREIAQPK